MIVVERKGGLGNQMFQYAFGIAAARRLGTDFAMEDGDLERVFLLGGRAKPDGLPRYPVVGVANDSYEEPEEVLARLRDDTTYAGFFQSERFFADAADEVGRAFRLRPEHEAAFRERYPDLLERPYVCCHVRRKDYVWFAGGAALPRSYYRRCLATLAPPPGTPIVFVGDDLGDAREGFGGTEGVRFEQNEPVLDLQLLMHAHALAISNSTFAWWGAWLNPHEGKRVLAPRYWLGIQFCWEYPPRVIPDGWTRVPVRRPWRTALSAGGIKTSVVRLRNASREVLRVGH